MITHIRTEFHGILNGMHLRILVDMQEGQDRGIAALEPRV